VWNENRKAGTSLFPVKMINIYRGKLGDIAGLDVTTVSRKMAILVKLGLISDFSSTTGQGKGYSFCVVSLESYGIVAGMPEVSANPVAVVEAPQPNNTDLDEVKREVEKVLGIPAFPPQNAPKFDKIEDNEMKLIVDEFLDAMKAVVISVREFCKETKESFLIKAGNELYIDKIHSGGVYFGYSNEKAQKYAMGIVISRFLPKIPPDTPENARLLAILDKIKELKKTWLASILKELTQKPTKPARISYVLDRFNPKMLEKPDVWEIFNKPYLKK
jgi:hypothetical protein